MFVVPLSWSYGQEPFPSKRIQKEFKELNLVMGPWMSACLDSNALGRQFPKCPKGGKPLTLVTELAKISWSKRELLITMIDNEIKKGINVERYEAYKAPLLILQCSGTGKGAPQARSYGDPHILTYDGERYSFQTVGEFVYSTSSDGTFQIQTRQTPVSDNFSINSAVALNVNGDRIGIYTQSGLKKPLIRINGVETTLKSDIRLEHGGILRSDFGYKIEWPTGELVTILWRKIPVTGENYLDIGVTLVSCAKKSFTGLLGNNNGVSNDDGFNELIVPDSLLECHSRDLKKAIRYLNERLSDKYRVKHENSLFDYEEGESTEFFTDRSYPKIIVTNDDITNDNKEIARRHCSDSGIGADDMEACIYDYTFLNITTDIAHLSELNSINSLFEEIQKYFEKEIHQVKPVLNIEIPDLPLFKTIPPSQNKIKFGGF